MYIKCFTEKKQPGRGFQPIFRLSILHQLNIKQLQNPLAWPYEHSLGLETALTVGKYRVLSPTCHKGSYTHNLLFSTSALLQRTSWTFLDKALITDIFTKFCPSRSLNLCKVHIIVDGSSILYPPRHSISLISYILRDQDHITVDGSGILPAKA